MASTIDDEFSATRCLGLRSPERKVAHESILAGFPFRSLLKFEAASGLTLVEILDVIQMPQRTLARRKHSGRLKPIESERLHRLAIVFQRAVELFGGREALAREWLRKPVRGLGHVAPLELVHTQVGAEMVLDLIGQLEHGVFP